MIEDGRVLFFTWLSYFYEFLNSLGALEDPWECLSAIMSVSLRGLLARLRMTARLAEKVSKDNLELFTEEALRLVSRGYTGCC